MEVVRITAAEGQQYDAWVRTHSHGTLWQSLEWQKFQEALGRETRIYALTEGTQILASALVIIDRTAFGFSTWDIPRGPIWEFGNRDSDLGLFLNTIVNDARHDRCFCLYLSPQIPLPDPLPQVRIPNPYSLSSSPRHEQPAATRIIDLAPSAEDILKQMKSKGRYNISVAEKRSIQVQRSTDISPLMRLLKKTGHRDNFTIHPRQHYEVFLSKLPGSFLFLATMSDGEPIAGLLGVIWGPKAIYYYGASDYDHRAFMAPYVLQWAAMRHAKATGCTAYDLLGIAPADAALDHPWQGVSMFKEKFGGSVVTYQPEQQIVLRPVTSRLLRLKRKLLG
ncbi:MAG: peptidoglycan bridge formation glycyltransferase FemA/FemB family protein [Candidatus Peregrinibacteria bacterium]